MVAHHVLDLGGIGVEPADDVHVLDAIRDPQVAELIEHADVTGVQPAVRVDRLRRGRRVFEVTAHHVVAAHHDLARLAGRHRLVVRVDDAHLGLRDRAAARRRDRHRVILATAHRHRAGGLGQAICRQHCPERQLRAHPLDEHDGHDSGAGDRQSQ